MPFRSKLAPRALHCYSSDDSDDTDDSDDSNDSDDDCFGSGDKHLESPESPGITNANDLNQRDTKYFDAQKVQNYMQRLMTVIEAEHVNELLEHLDRLHEPREKLIERNKLAVGLVLKETDVENCFKLIRADGKPFRALFKHGDNLTLFQDLAASDGSDSDASSGEEDAPDGHHQGSVGGASRYSSSIDGEGSADDNFPPASCCAELQAAQFKRKVEMRLRELHLWKLLDGCADGIGDKEMLLRTRHADAYESVALLLEHGGKCALMHSFQDSTYRIQKKTAETLDRLFSATKDPIRRDHFMRVAEEVRLRQILLCDPEVEDDRARAEEGAQLGVPWMDETVRAGLATLLASPALGLNEEQREMLVQATERSLTLLQGPPGTGKTRALGSLGAALLQVFHNPLGVAPEGFKLPSIKNMVDWSEAEVMEWVQSFSEESLRLVASKAFQGTDGRCIAHCAQSALTTWFAEVAEDDGSPAAAAPGKTNSPSKHAAKRGRGSGRNPCNDVARRFAEAFLVKRAAATEQLQRHYDASGYSRTADRDTRIIMCAESNTAANRLLESLVHALPQNEAQQYDIVRIGLMQEDEEGGGLARQYHVDLRREQHALSQIKSKLDEAMRRSAVTASLGAELQTRTKAWVKTKEDEASRCKRPLIARGWASLAKRVDEHIDVAGCVEVYLASLRAWRQDDDGQVIQLDKAQFEERKKDARRALKEQGKELFKAALVDILITAQLVVGTNTSIGEVRQLADDHNLSFPIVFMDEAGQSSEQSSMIPLTVGAEWVLLAGDLCQLPPTLKTEVARQTLGFDTETGGSQYGRLKALGVCELGLHQQYRMHPAIREFPSRVYYGGRLREAPGWKLEGGVPEVQGLFNWPMQKGSWDAYPIMFFDVAEGREASTRKSLHNLEEARLAMQLVLLLGTDPSVHSIAIISPYREQADYIGKCLQAAQPHLQARRKRGEFHPTHCVSHTVDGFQGHEADVVIITTVRNNPRGVLGHVKDARRLNVAVTRARRALLIVGNLEMLKLEPEKNDWARLVAHLHVAADRAIFSSQRIAWLQDKLPALPKEMGKVQP